MIVLENEFELVESLVEKELLAMAGIVQGGSMTFEEVEINKIIPKDGDTVEVNGTLESIESVSLQGQFNESVQVGNKTQTFYTKPMPSGTYIYYSSNDTLHCYYNDSGWGCPN